MDMDVQAYDSVSEFWSDVGHLYEADPVRHTMALTVLLGLRAAAANGVQSVDPLLVSISDGGGRVGAAFWTPPWPLGVSAVPPAAVPALIDFLRERGEQPGGVSGPRDSADPFAAAWPADAQISMNMRCYRLQTLAEPQVPGKPRLAGAEDLDLLTEWEGEFFHEANPGQQEYDDHRRRVAQSLAVGNAHVLWCVDGEVRAAARASLPQRGMSRVGVVYTPPEHRRRGYGAAVTAAASQWSLDNGAKDVVLFTDLANPTSNAIYQDIGYLPVYDAVEYRFGD